MVVKTDSSVLKSVVKLMTGEGIGRIIGFIAAPVITRIYSTSDLGILTVFASLCAMCYPFCTLKYSLVIPLHRNEKVAANAVAACFYCLLITTIVITLLFGLFHTTVLPLFSAASIVKYWYFLPIAFLLYGLYEILSMYATRFKLFSTIAVSSVIQKITGTAAKIGLGLLGWRPIGLIIGNIMTEAGGITVYLRVLIQNIKQGIGSITYRRVCFVFKKYRNFPLYRVPSQILLILAGNIPVLFFAWKYDLSTTGQIGLAKTMLSVPITFICTAVGKAFYGEIASLGREQSGEIVRLTKKIMKRLLLISLIPFLSVILFGPWLFGTIFGTEWEQAGVFARLFSFYLILQFVYSPISDGIFNVFEQQKTVLILEVTRISVVVLSFTVAYIANLDIYGTIIAYSLSLSLQYVLSIVFVFRILKKSTVK